MTAPAVAVLPAVREEALVAWQCWHIQRIEIGLGLVHILAP